jgi:hypothetical protein
MAHFLNEIYWAVRANVHVLQVVDADLGALSGLEPGHPRPDSSPFREPFES